MRHDYARRNRFSESRIKHICVFPDDVFGFSLRTGDRSSSKQYRPTFHELGGFIAGAEEYGYEMVPLMGAVATPAGAVQAEAYEALLDELLGLIRDAMPLDGLLLGLHGAFVAEEFPQGGRGRRRGACGSLSGRTFP